LLTVLSGGIGRWKFLSSKLLLALRLCSDVRITFFKTLYGLLPFVALSVFVTVLTSSRGVGIALSVGYFLLESIVGPLLHLSDTLAEVMDYLLIQSFRFWTAAPDLNHSSDAVRAFVVILAYTVFLVAGTSWIFKRRDIRGAIGD